MKGFIGIIAAVLVLILLFLSTYTLKEWEQGLVLQFGEFKRVENGWNEGAAADAGLKFKAPWESVIRLERRNIELDFPVKTISDINQKPFEVDSYVLFRITEPLKYYQKMPTQRQANELIEQLVDNSLRGIVANVDGEQLISERRSELMRNTQLAANGVAIREEYGFQITDIRVKRVELPSAVADSVYLRMQSEREEKARSFRAKGVKRKNEIIAEADRDAKIIIAEAGGKAQTIRGEGDAFSNKIYADAYGVDPEFFAFYRTMEAYRRGLGQKTSYILSPDSDFLSYLDDQNGGRR